MTDREVMKMAFDAFEDLKKSVTRDGTVSENWDAYYEKEYYALEALRQALAQPEQEPVAWITPDGEGFRMRLEPPVDDVPLGWKALYTAPPPKPWVGLTNEELVELRETHEAHIFQLMFAIEAKLKEKNGGV